MFFCKKVSNDYRTLKNICDKKVCEKLGVARLFCTFETGEDRVRLQVKKWAIQTNERAEAKAREAAEAKKNAKKAK